MALKLTINGKNKNQVWRLYLNLVIDFRCIITLAYPAFGQPMDILDRASSSESEVEVAPQDYSKCVQLHGPPRPGDRIAFKVTFLQTYLSWTKSRLLQHKFKENLRLGSTVVHIFIFVFKEKLLLEHLIIMWSL